MKMIAGYRRALKDYPDAIHIGLVRLLFSAGPQVVAVSTGITAAAGFIALSTRARSDLWITAFSFVVSCGRIALVGAYAKRRDVEASLSIGEALAWERWYWASAASSSLVIAILTSR